MSTSGKGFQVPYTTITLHAISRADVAPSIYCQLDEAQALEEEPTQDEEAELEMRELRIVPSTAESCESCGICLPTITHTFCASL
jgi:nucleotide-sensitive chloride channel 1A